MKPGWRDPERIPLARHPADGARTFAATFMGTKLMTIGLALGVLPLHFCTAADWPQWRGPHRDGISEEKVQLDWPATGPHVVWRASVGAGFSSPSVSRGRVYVMGNQAEQDTIWCLDAADGKVQWKHFYTAALSPQWYEGGPGATPTIESNCVFTISKWGNCLCLDASTGAVLWHQDLRQSGFKPNRWGFAGSPLLWRDLVIFNVGDAGVALNRKTGAVVWSNGTNAAGYASPVLANLRGREALLILAAKSLVALAPENGRELWRHPWVTDWDTNNTDPLVRENQVFLSSFSRGCALLSLEQDAPQVVYESKNLFNHLSPGIRLGEYLYAFSGEAKKDTDFRCLHWRTGRVEWRQAEPLFGSAICAGGALLLLTERGELLATEVSAGGLKIRSRAKLLDGRCWSPPALAEGRLFARTAKGELVCADLRLR